MECLTYFTIKVLIACAIKNEGGGVDGIEGVGIDLLF